MEARPEKRPGRGVRVLFGLAGAFDFLMGLVLLTTLGLRGFAGAAERTPSSRSLSVLCLS